MFIERSIQTQLFKLVRSRKSRTTLWTVDSPTDWRPTSVHNPQGDFDEHFTDASAWELIASELKNECKVYSVALERQSGKFAYLLEIDLGGDEPPVYVKIQLGSGMVIGRSFHY